MTQFLLKSDDAIAFEIAAGLNPQDKATLLEKLAAIERIIASQRCGKTFLFLPVSRVLTSSNAFFCYSIPLSSYLAASHDVQNCAKGISAAFRTKLTNSFSLLSHEDKLEQKKWYHRYPEEPEPFYGGRKLRATFVARSSAGVVLEFAGAQRIFYSEFVFCAL